MVSSLARLLDWEKMMFDRLSCDIYQCRVIGNALPSTWDGEQSLEHFGAFTGYQHPSRGRLPGSENPI
jgi:hypothetical protein